MGTGYSLSNTSSNDKNNIEDLNFTLTTVDNNYNYIDIKDTNTISISNIIVEDIIKQAVDNLSSEDVINKTNIIEKKKKKKKKKNK